MKNIENHIYSNRVKLFEATEQEKLEDAINQFGENHDIVSVQVNGVDHCMVGCGHLRASDYVVIWHATVVYRYDVTEHAIQKEIAQHLNAKRQHYLNELERKCNCDYSVKLMILGKNTVKEWIDEQMDAYQISDEYKKYRENVRDRHETPKRQLTKDEFDANVATLGEGAKIVFGQRIENARKNFDV